MIEGNKVKLRTVLAEDLEILLDWENREELWPLSGRTSGVTRDEMQDFVHGHHDLLLEKQLRLMICTLSNSTVGTLDLYEFNHETRSAGVGILIADTSNRRNGYGLESLNLLAEHCFVAFRMSRLFCTVQTSNTGSIALFEKAGYSNLKTENGLVYFELVA